MTYADPSRTSGKSQKVKEQTEIDFKKAEDPEIVVFGSSNLQVRLKAILKQAELATGSEKYSSSSLYLLF